LVRDAYGAGLDIIDNTVHFPPPNIVRKDYQLISNPEDGDRRFLLNAAFHHQDYRGVFQNSVSQSKYFLGETPYNILMYIYQAKNETVSKNNNK
jgi:hypothetical protein